MYYNYVFNGLLSVETGMNGNGSHPNHKNCGGTIGIRNILRARGGI
jgi:hypothetical protein